MVEQKHLKIDKFVDNLLTIGQDVLCEPDSDIIDLPEWFNLDKFQKGQAFYKKYIHANFFASLCGLVTILSVPTIQNVLVYTKQSGCAKTAYRRYVATILHVHTWYFTDIKDKESKLWKSIKNVRKLHLVASRQNRHANNGKISQKDMSLTGFGFFGYQLVCPEKVGIHGASREQFEAYIHLWRTIGYLLGIEDRFNICSGIFTSRKSKIFKNTYLGNIEETTYICSILLRDIFRPEICKYSVLFDKMTAAMLDGLWTISISLNRKVIMYSVCNLCNINSTIVPKSLQLNWYEYLMYLYLRFNYEFMLKSNLVRIILNFIDFLDFVIIQNLPLIAIFRFGYRLAYVRILKKNN